MEHITIQNIEKELHNLLKNKPMTCENLERFVLLSKSMKYLSRVRHEFTEEDAHKWVESMKPAARWTMEQTTAVMHQYGYQHRPCEFYAVMNALVSDYGKTMQKFSADRVDVWASLAHDWLCDEDAVEDKAGKYWRDIVRQSE